MSSGAPQSFFAWRQAGFQLASDLQQIGAVATRSGLPSVAAEAEGLHRMVVERRFHLAVVGEFKRGKSSLINALLGQEILPADVLPMTAAVNRVTYGLKPSARLFFRDGRPSEDLAVDALADTITKRSPTSAAVAATVSEVVVTWPVRLCRNDVDLIDTPGLSDEAAMTEITLDLLPKVDAAIFVIMATAPFSETEARFLDTLISGGITQFFFVVSGIDRIRRAADQERVVAAVRDRIASRVTACAEAMGPPADPARRAFEMRYKAPRVYPLSAVQALEGRTANDAELITASGLPALEAALETFLTSSDAMSLARRAQQGRALSASLRRSLRETPEVQAAVDPSPQLRQLLALVRGLEGPIDQARMGAAAWIPEAMGVIAPQIERFAGKSGVYLEVFERINTARTSAAAAWSTRPLPQALGLAEEGVQSQNVAAAYEGAQAHARSLAEGLHKTLHARTAQLAEVVAEQFRGVAASHLGEINRVLAATFTVLEFVDRALRDLDGGASVGAHTFSRIIQVELSVDELCIGLVPSPSIFESALVSPGVVEGMAAQRKKSDINRLFQLDFGGLAAAWQRLATLEVQTVLQVHFPSSTVQAQMRDWMKAGLRRSLSALDQATEALRRAEHNILTANSRIQARQEQRARARAGEALVLVELENRLAELEERLIPVLAHVGG